MLSIHMTNYMNFSQIQKGIFLFFYFPLIVDGTPDQEEFLHRDLQL